jgi:hypothetical protein
MSKLDFDPAAYQTERHANNPIGYAQRLEWRLQWEKAQIENWQTYRHGGGQQVEVAESLVKESEGGLNEKHQAPFQSRLMLNESSHSTEPGGSDQPYRVHSKIRYASSSPKEIKPATACTASLSMGSERVGRSVSTVPKSLSTIRTTPIPFNQQSQSTGVHIYQVDGKVEVALRNAGLNGKEGVTLISGLKRDLASLGLKLTRLILNGELLWQREATQPEGFVSTEMVTDEMPIDKIY